MARSAAAIGAAGLLAAVAAARSLDAPPPPGPLAAERELAAAGDRAPAWLGGPAESLRDPPRDLEALRARIHQIVASRGIAGAAVAVIENGEPTWIGGFGRADGAGRPVDGDTMFRVGSISKSFVAVTLMRLAESGRIDLDARVRDIAPELAIDNPWEAEHPLRISHLLEHTAGFDDMRFNEIFPADGREDHSLAEVLAVNPRSRRVRWPPGTRFSYSQPGYTVAAYLVEKVTGRPFETVVRDQVFLPLGLSSPSFHMNPRAARRLATGYQRGKPVAYQALLHRPAGGLMISARDVARLVQMELGRGVIDGRRFLAEASIERIERSGTLPYAPPSVAYGLGNWGDVSHKIPLRGHGGFVPGYFGLYRYAQGRGLGCVVLTNESGWEDGAGWISTLVMDYLLRDVSAPEPPRAPVPPGSLARLAGYYDFVSPEVEFLRFSSDLRGVTVDFADDRLTLSFPRGGRARLVPTSETTFRFPWESASSVVFTHTDDGRRALSMGGFFVEGDATRAALRRWAFDLAILLMLSTLAVAPAVLVHRRDYPGEATLQRAPLVAALCFLCAFFSFHAALGQRALGTVNIATVLVWLGSLAFACAALVGLRRCLESLRRPLMWQLKTHAFLAALACAGLAIFLARYGLIGLRTWAW